MTKGNKKKVVKGWCAYDIRQKRMTGAFESKFDLDQAISLEEGDLIIRCTITYTL